MNCSHTHFRSVRATAIFIFIAALSLIANAQHDHHAAASPARTSGDQIGVILLAHGGQPSWNEEVKKIAAVVDKQYPTEVAFGMATRRTIQEAVNKLEARGVSSIVAVPLFISSNSTVITSSEYLLGLRSEAPKDLAVFAKMDHGSHGGHGSHDMAGMSDMKMDMSDTKQPDPTSPVVHSVPLRMSHALDADPVVAQILLTRANDISKDAGNEVLIVVAHGPVDDASNRLWLDDMKIIASNIKEKSSYKRIDYLTVRDDAPEPIRSQATEEFRSVVQRALDEKAKVVVVPLLLSYGGIESGIKKRLDGLDYSIASQGLLPDPRIAEWIIRSVASAR